MGDKTGIEWTDATWNPIVGCSVITPGCTNCYAMKQAARIERMYAGAHKAAGGLDPVLTSHYNGTTASSKGGSVWTGSVALAPDNIWQHPLHWKRPRQIFVNSMGDLFHEGVPDAWIDRAFAVMALSPQHTFQVLTKRSTRMRSYLTARNGMGNAALCEAINAIPYWLGNRHGALEMPLPNVWLGVSTEDQLRANARIPDLLATPAALRFVSAEPLLGPIEFRAVKWGHHQALGGLDWVIVGGESGPGARPTHPDWVRSIRDQCANVDVPFFFKQWGEWQPLDQILERVITGPIAHAIVSRAGGHVLDSDIASPPEAVFTFKRGKRAAGRLLDGVEHNAFPQ